jgi:hypothetical protein
MVKVNPEAGLAFFCVQMEKNRLLPQVFFPAFS